MNPKKITYKNKMKRNQIQTWECVRCGAVLGTRKKARLHSKEVHHLKSNKKSMSGLGTDGKYKSDLMSIFSRWNTE